MPKAKEGKFEYAPFQTWERLLAMVLGLLLAAMGAWATLVSDNQGGTVALVLVGGVLLVIGLQGTPLVRLGGETASADLERRQLKRVADVLEDERSEGGPEEAAYLASKLVAAEPALSASPAVQGAQYEWSVMQALRRVSSDELVEPKLGPDSQYDAVIRSPGRLQTGVEVKYRSGGRLSLDLLHRVLHQLQKMQGSVDRWLLITNVPPTVEALRYLSAHPEIKLVTWRDAQDDDRLRDALLRSE